jgi:hypothetical protein
MRIQSPLPFLLVLLAACGGELEPSLVASMSTTIDAKTWKAGGVGHNAPTAVYYTQSGELHIFGMGDRPGGDGNQTVSLTIQSGGVGGTYLVGDGSAGAYARVGRTIGNLGLDTTAYTEVFLTSSFATGQAEVTLDLDERRSSGSFSFNVVGGRIDRTLVVSGGHWDLPVRIMN